MHGKTYCRGFALERGLFLFFRRIVGLNLNFCPLTCSQRRRDGFPRFYVSGANGALYVAWSCCTHVLAVYFVQRVNCVFRRKVKLCLIYLPCSPVPTSVGHPPLVLRHVTPRQELAQLGGGGHETICASVQEHIADTYLGYGGAYGGALSGSDAGDGDGGDVLGRRRRGEGGSKSAAAGSAAVELGRGGKKLQARGAWTVDPDGAVWTSSPPPLTQTKASDKASAAARKKGKRRGGAMKSGAARERASRGEGGWGGGENVPSFRLGGGGGGGGRTSVAGVVGDRNMEKNAARQRGEDLDKAQV